jgi:hypothetical protein
MISFINSNDIVTFAREKLGIVLNATQTRLLTVVGRRIILNCHRQWGKSTVAAILALYHALSYHGYQVVIVSIDARRSQKLANLCRELAARMGVRVKGDGTNPRAVVFPNGSSIIPLPGRADAVRGFTANLLIIDEAARVADEVFTVATPMLAATDGDLWLLSTPKGKRGFFYEIWSGPDSAAEPWTRVEGKASTEGRVTKGFLAHEGRRKTGAEFDAEYECQFGGLGRQVFADEWIERAFAGGIPTFDELSRTDLQFVRHRPAYYLSLDLGYARDHAALILLEYRATPTGTRDPETYQFLYRRELRVVHIERFRLRTGLTDLVARVTQLCNHPHLAGNTQLLIDVTSQPMIAQVFRDAKLPVNLIPVTISAGERVVVSGSDRSVPKKLLVGSLELLLEKGYLKIAAALAQADLLRDELRQFERTSARGGGEKYGAGAGHDDLVMALAMAGWWAWTNRKGLLSGPEAKPLD